jgi:galactose-1-phosphate uridylyltransferase
VTPLATHITWKMYLERKNSINAEDLTATHSAVTELTRKVEGQGYKLYLAISSPPPTYMMT